MELEEEEEKLRREIGLEEKKRRLDNIMKEKENIMSKRIKRE